MSGPERGSPTPLDAAHLQDRAVRGVAWTMIHTVVSVPIAFAVNLLLARILEPEGYGRLAFLTTLMTLAGSVLALGLSSAMIQFGAKAHAAGRTHEVRRILSSSQGFRLIFVAPVLTALVLLLIDVPLPLLFLGIIFGIWVPAALDGGPIGLILESKTAQSARIAMLTNIVVQIGVVISVLTVGTADGVWATRIVVSGVCIGLALLAISPAYRAAVLRPRLPRHFPPGFWKFAIPTGIAGLLGDLVLSRTEVIFLEAMSTPTAVGLFALAFGVSSHIFAPAQALTGPLLPAISGLREVDESKVGEAFARTLRGSSTVVALVTAASLPALALLVPALYGEGFRAAAPAVLVLGCVSAVRVACTPVSAFVLARLSARTFLLANIVALVVDVVVAVALIPSLGLWGAVVANAMGTLTRVAVLLRSEYRNLAMPVRDVVAALWPVLICIIASVLAWTAARAVAWPVIVEATVSAIGALLVLLAGIRLTRTGLSPADRDAVKRAIPGRAHSIAAPILALVTQR